MAVIVLLTAVAALLWPQAVGVIKTSWISWLLGIVMFGMGLAMRWEDFRVVFVRPKDTESDECAHSRKDDTNDDFVEAKRLVQCSADGVALY